MVPTISLYEVFKRTLQQKGEDYALEAPAIMMQARVIDLDATLAISAAKISAELKIPMADSIMLATARDREAILWTQDIDFADLPEVRYIEK